MTAALPVATERCNVHLMPYFTGSDGTRLHYEVVGSGPPLVLHTGGAGDGSMWKDAGYVDVLAPMRACVLFDHRGHGRSDQPATPAAHAVSRYVDDIIALLDHLKLEKAAFWGYSQGANFGLSAAALHPDRFGAVITTGGWTPQDKPLAEDPAAAKAMLDGAERIAALLRERGWDGLVKDWNWKLTPWFRRQVDATNPEMLALWYDAYGLWDTWALLPQIAAPVLMFVGDLEDVEHGTESAASRVRDARVVRLAGEDHITAYARSELVLPIATTFLTDTAAEAPPPKRVTR